VNDECARLPAKDEQRAGPADMNSTAVIVPTYNAGSSWREFRTGLDSQGISNEQVLIVDSSSTDGTAQLARDAGYQVLVIPKAEFSHGATRQMAANRVPWAETLVYMTQDAILCDEHSIRNLLKEFDNPAVGAAYGRQISRPAAGPIERHARLFNYPSSSLIRDFEDRKRMGFRATFFSNSFAAYRRTAFDQVGGFPENVIMLEDMTVAARMLMSHWKIAYCADAQVIHSHSFSLSQEFSRYFDIAVHHAREPWLLEAFGKAGEEGKSFVLSELRYLRTHGLHLIPIAILRNFSKWLAYHAGLLERYQPLWANRWMSAQKTFWDQRAVSAGGATTNRVVPLGCEIRTIDPTIGGGDCVPGNGTRLDIQG
jgi:rhamnosyltransferase